MVGGRGRPPNQDGRDSDATPTTNHQLPTTNYKLPTTIYQLPTTMISSQFKRDYAQMTAQGVTFTPEDIVRLNALAVKVRLAQNAGRAGRVALPRLAFLDTRLCSLFPVPCCLILREPTIAHELWIEEASQWIDTSDDRNFLWLHGYALSRPAEKLVDAFAPKKVVKAVYTFAAKRLCGFTHEQLSAAVEYVLFGANWVVGEKATAGGDARLSGRDGELRDPDEASSPTIGVLTTARALRLGITLDDAKKMTASELEEAILAARINDGDYDAQAAKNAAFAEYVRAREEIRGRELVDGRG